MPSSAFVLSKDATCLRHDHALWWSFWYFYFRSAFVTSALLDLKVPIIRSCSGQLSSLAPQTTRFFVACFVLYRCSRSKTNGLVMATSTVSTTSRIFAFVKLMTRHKTFKATFRFDKYTSSIIWGCDLTWCRAVQFVAVNTSDVMCCLWGLFLWDQWTCRSRFRVSVVVTWGLWNPFLINYDSLTHFPYFDFLLDIAKEIEDAEDLSMIIMETRADISTKTTPAEKFAPRETTTPSSGQSGQQAISSTSSGASPLSAHAEHPSFALFRG